MNQVKFKRQILLPLPPNLTVTIDRILLRMLIHQTKELTNCQIAESIEKLILAAHNEPEDWLMDRMFLRLLRLCDSPTSAKKTGDSQSCRLVERLCDFLKAKVFTERSLTRGNKTPLRCDVHSSRPKEKE